MLCPCDPLAALASTLLDATDRSSVKSCQMVAKEIALQNGKGCYLERSSSSDTSSHDILIVPGFTQDCCGMLPFTKFLIDQMPTTCRVIIMELPMHGKLLKANPDTFPSYTDYLNHIHEFIQKLQLGVEGRGISLIGFSLGAGFLLSHAAAHPQCVTRVCLIAPYMWGDTTTDECAERSASKSDHMMSKIADTRELSKVFTHFMGVYKEQLPPAFFLRAMSSKMTEGGSAYWAQVGYSMNSRPDAQNRLQQISSSISKMKVPSLIIVGARDNVVSPDKIKLLQEKIGPANCTLHVLPDCGHLGGPRGANFVKVNTLTLAGPIVASFLKN